MNIREERELLFDENFKPKSSDVDRIKAFCGEVSRITNIQTCNDKGMIYEYLPQVYNSALKLTEQN